MSVNRWWMASLLASGVVLGAETSAPIPVSTNRDDAPPRVKSGKVFASTDAALPPALGPSQAKVVLVVFSDFQCPVCRRSADATQQIAEEFPGDVRVEFWQHALTTHADAENAAVASLAAERQGKFWEYHDEVFRNQSSLGAESLARYAATVGLDVERFKADYADAALRERAKQEAAFAEKFGAKSTPAFMLNGKVKTGWGSWYGFRYDVEHELAEAKRLEAAGIPVEEIASERAKANIEDPELLAAYREQVLRLTHKDLKRMEKNRKRREKSKNEG